MNHLIRLVIALAVSLLAVDANAQAPTPEQKAQIAKMETLLKALHPATGDIIVPGADAVLHLGKDYYFLPANEARRVLTEGWGNPPDSVGNVLGLVFPAGTTFLDDVWGAVISFDAVGYVSDDDAQSTDYGELLKQMQEGETEANAARVEAGYPAQNLVGWAQQPVYDPGTHSVVWAQNIAFQGSRENTLNYDVRLLGRKGVLSLNMVTGMSKLEETRKAAEKFARSASFNQGARYADYRPGADKKADYGVAGLVAAGVGAVAVKKLGLLAIVLAFAKKFLVLIIAGFAVFGAWIKRRFGGGTDSEPSAEIYEAPTPTPEDGIAATASRMDPGDPQEPRPTGG